MTGNFHERLAAERLEPPSERSTGRVFAAIAAIVGLYHFDTVAILALWLVVAATFAGLAQFWPEVLQPLNTAWFRLSLLLAAIVNPAVMLVIYVTVIVPLGLVMQCVRDPLLARWAPQAKTYWIESSEPVRAGSMRNQF